MRYLGRLCCLLIYPQDGNDCHKVHQELGCWFWPGLWSPLPSWLWSLGSSWALADDGHGSAHILSCSSHGSLSGLSPHPQLAAPAGQYHTSAIACKECNAEKSTGAPSGQIVAATIAVIICPGCQPICCPLAHVLHDILVHLFYGRPCSRQKSRCGKTSPSLMP